MPSKIPMKLPSWGHYPDVPQKSEKPYFASQIPFAHQQADADSRGKFLARGMGRSYGDVCLLTSTGDHSGTLIETTKLNRIKDFDPISQEITAEGGISLDSLLQYLVPRGFFLPVSPGTKFVSLGGAIANDIHGKNHHIAGTFGRFVKKLSLLRSTGEVLVCSPFENTAMFNATIAGLGLTGVILDATIEVIPIVSSYIDQETIRFNNLKEFFELAELPEAKKKYTVAWIDCLARGDSLGRGHFITGDHSSREEKGLSVHKNPNAACPWYLPPFVLNQFSIKVFNGMYYNRQQNKKVQAGVHYNPFFYPLDSILHWNRMYGKRGFVQFQCVIPPQYKVDGISEILNVTAKAGIGSFLAVLKEFGGLTSPGLLSFPRPGATLCLDFPFDGNKTISLYRKVEDITASCGGALYPAKDALMSREHFHTMYPRFSEFLTFVDSKCSSQFFKRIL